MRLIDADAMCRDLETVNPAYHFEKEWTKSILNAQLTVKMVYLPEYQKFDWVMQTIESDDEKGREKARRKFLRSLRRKVNENFDLAVRYKEFSGDIHPHLNDGEALYEFRIVIEKTDLEGEKDET